MVHSDPPGVGGSWGLGVFWITPSCAIRKVTDCRGITRRIHGVWNNRKSSRTLCIELCEALQQRTFHQDVELVAKPHRHFLNVIMTQANCTKATNILI